MPTIDVSLNDLSKMLGRDLTLDELDELVLYAKGELDGVEGDTVKLDMKDTNRPDLWSTEGIIRQLRGNLGIESGLPAYTMEDSDIEVYADPALKDVRPYCVNAVVLDLCIDEAFLSQIIQLQEKIALTFGRKRKEVAVGIIDFDKIEPPIYYKATKPDENAFVPLTFSKRLTPREILKVHPKGMEYGHLIEGSDVYPILVDSRGVVLTMPPVINSEDTGKVTTSTKNIFIDITGYDRDYLKTALNVIVSAFAERGGRVLSVKVHYDDGVQRLPDMTPMEYTLKKGTILGTLGIGLDDDEIIGHLRRMRYDAEIDKDDVRVRYLPYRKDIMHPFDIIEDIAISYGYNDIAPEIPRIYTIGRLLPVSRKLKVVREIMVGLGYQEILSFTLSSNEQLYDRMGIDRPADVVEIENPVSQSWSVMRDWISPALLSFLSKNTHWDYPQNIFEVSEVINEDKASETRVDSRYKLSCALCNSSACFTRIMESLDNIMSNLGLEYKVLPVEHGSFLDGRVGSIVVGGQPCGLIGEVHPKVLENWGIETPTALAELEIERLLE